MAKISTIIKILKNAGKVIAMMFPFDLPTFHSDPYKNRTDHGG